MVIDDIRAFDTRAVKESLKFCRFCIFPELYNPAGFRRDAIVLSSSLFADNSTLLANNSLVKDRYTLICMPWTMRRINESTVGIIQRSYNNSSVVFSTTSHEGSSDNVLARKFGLLKPLTCVISVYNPYMEDVEMYKDLINYNYILSEGADQVIFRSYKPQKPYRPRRDAISSSRCLMLPTFMNQYSESLYQNPEWYMEALKESMPAYVYNSVEPNQEVNINMRTFWAGVPIKFNRNTNLGSGIIVGNGQFDINLKVIDQLLPDVSPFEYMMEDEIPYYRDLLENMLKDGNK